MSPEHRCNILGDGFANFVQLLLGIAAISVLIIKRYRETNKRPLLVWVLDTSKQGIAAFFGHMMNILIAEFFSSSSKSEDADECAFYFINYLMDVTLGMLLMLLGLHFQQKLAGELGWRSLQVSGDYGNPPSMIVWANQAGAWVCLVFLSKLIVTVMIFAMFTPMAALGAWMLSPWDHYPRTKLLVVMLLCPCLMNGIQFWVQDNFLRMQKSGIFPEEAQYLLAKFTDSPDLTIEKDELHDDATTPHRHYL